MTVQKKDPKTVLFLNAIMITFKGILQEYYWLKKIMQKISPWSEDVSFSSLVQFPPP